MLKRFVLVIGFLLGLAAPATAFDLSAMTDAERQQFRDEVRAYLLENPEIILEAIQILDERRAQAAADSDAAIIAHYGELIFDDGFSHVAGNPEGDVTVVEFLDYKCGYCKKAYPEVMELLRSDGDIRFVIKEFPILGDESDLAANFVLSAKLVAGEDAYFALHNALMKESGRLTEGSLRRMARDLGLDDDAIIAGMDNPEIDRIINTNRALAQAMQITGTPSFVFGDQMLRGYAPLNVMEDIVAELRDN